MLIKQGFKEDRGFTLVEVLVALSILTIIIISFTTLLTSSYRNIISAGNKSQATYHVQMDMEEHIADEQATDVGELEIFFPGVGDITVPGGLLEIDDTQGGRTSESTAFLPVLVVIIEPDPQYHLVGIAQTITVNIKTRNVVFGKDVDVSLYKLTSPDTSIASTSGVINSNIATLTLEVPANYDPGESENDFNHIISVEIDGIDRVFQVFYRIFRPAFLAGAPSGKIYVASNAADLWEEIDTTVAHDILDIYSLGSKFIAIGRSGTILTSDFGSTWTDSSVASGDLHAMTTNASRFVIVGQDGTILISNNSGTSWTDNSNSVVDYVTEANETFYKDITNNLLAVANIGTNFVAVGDGIILNSTDNGNTWQEVINSGTFNDVTYAGENFIAVGNSGWIYTSPDGETWTSISISGVNLNGVTHDISGKAVAVGSGGKIFYSEDQGATWSSATSVTANNLMSVTFGYGKFVAVGASGTILTSNDGVLWSLVPTSEITANLLTVIDR